MSERAIHEVEPKIIDRLALLSRQHQRTIEEEHKAILCDALLNKSSSESNPAFDAILETIPNVGNDSDVALIRGTSAATAFSRSRQRSLKTEGD